MTRGFKRRKEACALSLSQSVGSSQIPQSDTLPRDWKPCLLPLHTGPVCSDEGNQGPVIRGHAAGVSGHTVRAAGVMGDKP